MFSEFELKILERKHLLKKDKVMHNPDKDLEIHKDMWLCWSITSAFTIWVQYINITIYHCFHNMGTIYQYHNISLVSQFGYDISISQYIIIARSKNHIVGINMIIFCAYT